MNTSKLLEFKEMLGRLANMEDAQYVEDMEKAETIEKMEAVLEELKHRVKRVNGGKRRRTHRKRSIRRRKTHHRRR